MQHWGLMILYLQLPIKPPYVCNTEDLWYSTTSNLTPSCMQHWVLMIQFYFQINCMQHWYRYRTLFKWTPSCMQHWVLMLQFYFKMNSFMYATLSRYLYDTVLLPNKLPHVCNTKCLWFSSTSKRTPSFMQHWGLMIE